MHISLLGLQILHSNVLSFFVSELTTMSDPGTCLSTPQIGGWERISVDYKLVQYSYIRNCKTKGSSMQLMCRPSECV